MESLSLNTIINWVLGGGFVAVITFLITAPYIRKKANAEAVSKEIDNDTAIDKRYKGLLEELKSFYTQRDMLRDKENSLLSDELKNLKAELQLVKKNVSELRNDIRIKDRKISKRDYIIRQSDTCVHPTNPQDCPVRKTQIELDQKKTERIEFKESIS